jgi:SAM-dependent methyltransferase
MRGVTRLLSDTRAFFGPRAAGWDDKFGDDGPAYARAVAELAPPPGAVVLDAGCGTGRAMTHLRAAVGRAGTVVAVDATPEMLAAARTAGRDREGSLVLGDASALPLRDGGVHAVFAAGLLPHLADPQAGLAELARVCVPDGRLALFHPVGRATLAARHGSAPSDDDVLSAARLPGLLAATGWTLLGLDDAEDRYLALAARARAR